MEDDKQSPQWWKPSWNSAPKWAMALALDGRGTWYWISDNGSDHTARNGYLVNRCGTAWSECAKAGPRDFRCSDLDALKQWEMRPNAKVTGSPALSASPRGLPG